MSARIDFWKVRRVLLSTTPTRMSFVIFVGLVIVAVLCFIQVQALRERCSRLEKTVQEHAEAFQQWQKRKEEEEEAKASAQRSMEESKGKNEMGQSLDSLSSSALAQQMSAVDGVPIDDRRSGAAVFYNSFLGSEAVDWLVDRFDVSRKKATSVCQQLLLDNEIERLEGGNKFTDDRSFYRFRGYRHIKDIQVNVVQPDDDEDLHLHVGSDGHTEGWLSIYVLAYWRKQYFIQRGEKLLMYDNIPADGGVEIGVITLAGVVVNSIDEESLTIEISNDSKQEIFDIHTSVESPAMSVISKLSGVSCQLRASGKSPKMSFVDWLLCFEQLGMLRIVTDDENKFMEERRQAIYDSASKESEEDFHHSLTAKEKDFLKQTRESLESSETDVSLRDEDIVRFYRASEDSAEASGALNAYLQWADEYRPKEITYDQVRKVAESGVIHAHYHNRRGNPCLVIRPRHYHPVDVDDMTQFVIYVIEETLRRSEPPYMKQITAIFDFEGYNRSDIDLKLAKRVLSMLEKYYPERLERVYVINHSWMLSLVWTVIEPLLDPETRRKIMFIRKNETLKTFFSGEYLLEEHGGSSEFNFDESSSMGFETLDKTKK